jgi:3-dehydroquinate synthase
VKRHTIEFPGSPPKRCTVLYGNGLLEEAAGFAASLAGGTAVAVVSDETVAGLYGGRLLEALRDYDLIAEPVVIAPGESGKNWETLGKVLLKLPRIGVGRDGLVIALGGGVPGDIGGLAAALYCRGIAWIQMPTTTLAMADSALGGKTAVNSGGAKNLIGAFHQPSALFADLDTLATLPTRHLRAGLAEVVKTALMLDLGFFEQLESSPRELLDHRGPRLRQALERCARLKGEIVARDEREAGERAVLNAGHTIGHALEAAAPELLHGEAVALGLLLECRLAERLAGFPPEDTQRLERLLHALDLPTVVPRGLDTSRLAELIGLDKKSKAGELRFALPAAVGRPYLLGGEWTSPVGLDRVMDLLKE